MRRFVIRQNIERFERLLASDVDGIRRLQLERLLSEARHELAGLQGIWSWTCPHLGINDSIGAEAENLLDEIVNAHGAQFGSLQVWDNAADGLRLIAHSNFDRGSAEQFAIVRNGDGTVCEAAQATQAPVIIEDIEKGRTFVSLRDWTQAIGIRAIQTTPVFGHSRKFVGAFSTHYATPRAFSYQNNKMNSMYAERMGFLLAKLER